MKFKKSMWRACELLFAATFGGVLSIFIAKFYETQDFAYFWGLAFMFSLIFVFLVVLYYGLPEDW